MEQTSEFDAAVGALLSFLEVPLTQTVADLEQDLAGKGREDVAAILREYRLDGNLLRAALLARERLGRVNDVIHSTAIALVLPDLLEPGETLRRPSLAAGNDPS